MFTTPMPPLATTACRSVGLAAMTAALFVPVFCTLTAP